MEDVTVKVKEIEKLANGVAVKKFFGATVGEVKALSKEDREELGTLCKTEMVNQI